MSAYDEDVCPNGHARTAANTRRYWNRRGGTYTIACLTCARERMRTTRTPGRLRQEAALLCDLVARYRRSHGSPLDPCTCPLCHEAGALLTSLPADPQEAGA